MTDWPCGRVPVPSRAPPLWFLSTENSLLSFKLLAGRTARSSEAASGARRPRGGASARQAENFRPSVPGERAEVGPAARPVRKGSENETSARVVKGPALILFSHIRFCLEQTSTSGNVLKRAFVSELDAAPSGLSFQECRQMY